MILLRSLKILKIQLDDFVYTITVNVEQIGKYWIYRLSNISFKVIFAMMKVKLWQGDCSYILSWLNLFKFPNLGGEEFCGLELLPDHVDHLSQMSEVS